MSVLLTVLVVAGLFAMLSICCHWWRNCTRTLGSSAPARAAPTPRVERVVVAVIASDGRPLPPRGVVDTRVQPPSYSFPTTNKGGVEWEQPPPPYDSLPARQLHL